MQEEKLANQSLIRRCTNGNKGAWDQFVERYAGLVFWAIKDVLERRGCLHNHQDIQDIFQNVFILLWEKGKLKQIRKRASISKWLAMVAANCAVNYFRNKRELLLRDDSEFEKIEVCNCNVNKDLNQEHIYITLEEAFHALSVREKIILKLNYLYRKTHQQIGQILAMPENTVSSTISRIKHRLREQLEKES